MARPAVRALPGAGRGVGGGCVCASSGPAGARALIRCVFRLSPGNPGPGL
uniref:Uncharacterized protein n=1 Tax=Human herpesvirus 2 TaxID=10310 RepID=A0A481TCZ2_HHV2|nr:hypothetical protein [Human alphaherpesvirus 2]